LSVSNLAAGLVCDSALVGAARSAGLLHDVSRLLLANQGFGGAEYLSFSEAGEGAESDAEAGGCTSNGEEESALNKYWISYDESSGPVSLSDGDDGVDRGDWPVTWVRWSGATAFADFPGATLATYARKSDLPERGNNHFGFRFTR
jgi:hypothetical protein